MTIRTVVVAGVLLSGCERSPEEIRYRDAAAQSWEAFARGTPDTARAAWARTRADRVRHGGLCVGTRCVW